MKTEIKYTLEEMQRVANVLIENLKLYCQSIEAVGSIRRKRPEVNDCDLLVLNPHLTFTPNVAKLGELKVTGKQIIRVIFDGKKIDFYLVNSKNYEIIKLIRTGSESHNIMLCRKAIGKGLRLKFDRGLVDKDGNVIANTEHDILQELLGKVPTPEEREVNV